jgi:trehalose 2-sulfotransferase
MTHSAMRAHGWSYFICSTPRTGSTLLCGLLATTGVAGRPESYFRRQDEGRWASGWGIRRPDGTFDYRDYFRAADRAGRTANGVFAARVMWGTLEEMSAHLGRLYPAHIGDDLALLGAAFGPPRFVYLRRDDGVGQAVSRLRAEQTGVWSEATGTPRTPPAAIPHFDATGIGGYVREAEEHNAAWQAWFSAMGVEPLEVVYEDLARDPTAAARRVLDHLGIVLPLETALVPAHRQLADALNEEWARRYQATASLP